MTNVLAHLDLLERSDLPIPEWLFAWGASAVLVISFVALTLLWREPRLEEDGWRPAPSWLSRAIAGRPTAFAAGLVGVGLLVLTIMAALTGTEDPNRNFAITFIFVTFWVGLVGISVVFGDVFRAFNPWRAIARVFAWVFGAIAGQAHQAPLRYPQRLGRWPAVAGLGGFLWLEHVYGEVGGVGLEPRVIAIAALLYSIYTLSAMALFGVEKWLRNGETFSVYFGMFASISAIEVRDGTLGFRRFLSGAKGWVGGMTGSAAMVLVSLGGTVYDGAAEGPLAGMINWLFNGFGDAGFDLLLAQRLSHTIPLILTILAVTAIFWAGVAGMRTVGGQVSEKSTRELGRAFVHSFIPIALAYLVAHYFTLVFFLEQAQFTYLLNDPFGDGSNLFGIEGSAIDYEALGSKLVWYIQVGALVIGHVLALVLAHDRAVAMFRDSRVAARSQYWMLALMIGFTSLGLYLLSEANK